MKTGLFLRTQLGGNLHCLADLSEKDSVFTTPCDLFPTGITKLISTTEFVNLLLSELKEKRLTEFVFFQQIFSLNMTK